MLQEAEKTEAAYRARGTSISGNSGFPSAAAAATEARDLIDNLREHVASINGHAAHLDPRNLKQLAGLFGQEWANDYQKRLQGSLAGAIELLGVKQTQIAERFTVTGSLTRREEDGSYAMGAFALQPRGFDTRIGSDGRVVGDAPPPPPQATAPAGPIDLRA